MRARDQYWLQASTALQPTQSYGLAEVYKNSSQAPQCAWWSWQCWHGPAAPRPVGPVLSIHRASRATSRDYLAIARDCIHANGVAQSTLTACLRSSAPEQSQRIYMSGRSHWHRFRPGRLRISSTVRAISPTSCCAFAVSPTGSVTRRRTSSENINFGAVALMSVHGCCRNAQRGDAARCASMQLLAPVH